MYVYVLCIFYIEIFHGVSSVINSRSVYYKSVCKLKNRLILIPLWLRFCTMTRRALHNEYVQFVESVLGSLFKDRDSIYGLRLLSWSKSDHEVGTCYAYISIIMKTVLWFYDSLDDDGSSRKLNTKPSMVVASVTSYILI